MNKRLFLLSSIAILFACKSEKQEKGFDIKKNAITINYKKTNMDIIELHDGSSVKCNYLTKDEYDKLLKDTIGEEILKPHGIIAHKLSNMSVVATKDYDYTLFFSMSDLDKVIANSENGRSSSEALMNKNKYGEAFPNATKDLIKNLLDTLSIDHKPLTGEFLLEIDRRIEKLDDAQWFMKEHIMNLIAVVGETLISKYHGKWKMKLGKDGVTWNPYLEKIEGMDFFIDLYEDVFINEPKYHVLYQTYENVVGVIKFNN